MAQDLHRVQSIGSAKQVVLDLMDGFENKGHVLDMDNFYANPGLLRKLQEKQIGVCGIVQSLCLCQRI